MLPQVDPSATYYVRVEAGRSGVFGIGAYGLAVSGVMLSTSLALIAAAYHGRQRATALAVCACVCVVNGSFPPSNAARRSPPAPERRIPPLCPIANA